MAPVLVLIVGLTASCRPSQDEPYAKGDPYSKIDRISYQFDESDTEGAVYIIDNKDKKFLLLYGVYTDTRPLIRVQDGISVGHILKTANSIDGDINIKFFRFTVAEKFILDECEVTIEAADLDLNLLAGGNQHEVEYMLEERDYQVGRPKCEKKNLISSDNVVWEARVLPH